VQRRLRAAWALGDADQAKTELERLARSLDRQRPGAAASLREGLELTGAVERIRELEERVARTEQEMAEMRQLLERQRAGRANAR
jgi:putative transposase